MTTRIIDLDNVVFNYDETYRVLRKGSPHLRTEKEILGLMLKLDLLANMELIEGAKEQINEWYDLGDRIIFATLRTDHWYPIIGAARRDTERSLEQNGIRYHEIMQANDGRTKKEIYRKLKPDMVIDDNHIHISEAIREGVPAIIYFGLSKFMFGESGVHYARDWQDIKKISELQENKGTAENQQ